MFVLGDLSIPHGLHKALISQNVKSIEDPAILHKHLSVPLLHVRRRWYVCACDDPYLTLHVRGNASKRR